MQNYIVRVYRARAGDAESVSGYVEDIESGKKESFHNISKLQTLLANSILRGQLVMADIALLEMATNDKIAAHG